VPRWHHALVCSERLGSKWVLDLVFTPKLSLESRLHHTQMRAFSKLWLSFGQHVSTGLLRVSSCRQRTTVVGESRALPCNSCRLWLPGAEGASAQVPVVCPQGGEEL